VDAGIGDYNLIHLSSVGRRLRDRGRALSPRENQSLETYCVLSAGYLLQGNTGMLDGSAGPQSSVAACSSRSVRRRGMKCNEDPGRVCRNEGAPGRYWGAAERNCAGS